MDVSVGHLAYLLVHDEDGATHLQGRLSLVEQILAGEGKLFHEEPKEPLAEKIQGPSTITSMEFLLLQRAYAYLKESRQDSFEPTESLSPFDQRVIKDAQGDLDSHLLCHPGNALASSSVFVDPIVDDRAPGGILLSGLRLLRELEAVAPLIDIPLLKTLGPWPGQSYKRLSDSTIQSLTNIDPDSKFSAERRAWYCLFQATVVSGQYRCHIVFH